MKNDSSLLEVNDLKAYFYLDEGVLKSGLFGEKR
jgi:hypothetical protein